MRKIFFITTVSLLAVSQIVNAAYFKNKSLVASPNTLNPSSLIHVDGGSASGSEVRWTANATTGQTTGDGLTVGIDASGNAEIRQKENLPLTIYTNNTARQTIGATGTITFNAYGTGIAHLDSSGVMVSKLVENADIIANAAIPDSKLATITTAGKVATSAVVALRTANIQSGPTYTFALVDGSGAGGFPYVSFTSGFATTATVPPNSSVAFPVGSQIDMCQDGGGKLTIASGSGVIINSDSNKLSAAVRYVCLTLMKTATDTWRLIGNLSL